MEYIKNTIAENFGGGEATHSLAKPEYQFSLDNVPDLSGKVAVITGGNEGIGYGCTHTLLAHNISKIIILARSAEVYEGAIQSLSEDPAIPNASSVASKISFHALDLANYKQVVEITNKIVKETDRIDILILNAAYGIMPYKLSDDGVDYHMAVNVFGHMTLTSHLMPVLKSTASKGNKVRIVCAGSNAHPSSPSDTKFASLEELNQDLGPNGLYGRSKLANILYARYLNKHLTQGGHPNILANAMHPGFVATKASEHDILEAFPIMGYMMTHVMQPFKKDQFQGCVSSMFCATKTEKSGEYICPPAIPEPGSELSQDMELAENLVKLARSIVSEKTYKDSVQKGCPFEFY